jgi:uncharacterized membrane protein
VTQSAAPATSTGHWGTLLLGLSYPVLAHAAILTGRPGLIAASIGVLATLVLLAPLRRGRAWAWLAYAAALAGLYRLSHSSLATLPLLIPPVVLNAFMAWVFGHTLARGQVPLIERLARVMRDPGTDLPTEVVRYTRRVTQAWTLLFVVLTAVNLALALCANPQGLLLAAGVQPPFTVPLELWSLFANVLNYVFVGALFVLEYAWRQHRLPQQGYRNFFDFTRRVIRLGALFRPSA